MFLNVSIFTNPECVDDVLAIIPADGTPVLAKDFSQSWDEGPRMSPSIYARPGHRVQALT